MSAPIVYLVDDDPAVLRSLGRLLQAEGHEVEAYASAEAFLAAWAGQPGVLVLDIVLGGMSGPELVEHLSAVGRSLPTILVSAHAAELSQGDRDAVLAVLEKPVRSEDLIDNVERALSLAGSVDPDAVSG